MEVPRFWRGQDARYNLSGTRCNECGQTFLGDRPVCPNRLKHGMGGGGGEDIKVIGAESYPFGDTIRVIIHPPHERNK